MICQGIERWLHSEIDDFNEVAAYMAVTNTHVVYSDIVTNMNGLRLLDW